MQADDYAQELPEAAWTDTLAHEVRLICLCPVIEGQSVSVSTDRRDRVRIQFRVCTDPLVEPVPTPIRDVEPITFTYPSMEDVGLRAPAVWSGRSDFPRDIGHINPTPPDHPASLCLARAGLQPIYDRYGVLGVVERLLHWISDAKTGQLMIEEWEPVPAPEDQELSGGYFDIATFQELAMNHCVRGGWRCGIGCLLKEDLGNGVVLVTPELDLENETAVRVARDKIYNRSVTELGVATYIPWVFVWSDIQAPVDHPLFGAWNTLGDIEDGVRDTNIGQILFSAVMTGALGLSNREDFISKPMALLLGIWRPVSISDKVFGVSKDATARRLELRGFLLHCEKHPSNPIEPRVEARQLIPFQLPNRQMLNFTSGKAPDGSVALFGCGAVGSFIADSLFRAGIPRIGVFDNDTVAPHNLTRHTSTGEHLYMPKSKHLKELSSSLTYPGGEIDCSSSQMDIAGISEDHLLDVTRKFPLIVDATASELVRRRLADSTVLEDTQILRAEIFHLGQLGVLFVTGAGNCPNLVDLYYALCACAVGTKVVEGWLRHEQAQGTFSEELLVGMGCASPTTRMPKYTVAQHASAFMPNIMSALSGESLEPGFGINPTTSSGLPLGWQWFPYGGSTSVLESPDAPGWSVRLAPSVSRVLAERRVNYGKLETGGYLYGGYDQVLKQVYVVAASDVPPGTTQSTASIQLGPAGRTQYERKLARRAGGKLLRVGTWHSHPSSGPDMSPKDRRTMERFRDEDRRRAIPTLLVVTSPAGNGAHLWV